MTAKRKDGITYGQLLLAYRTVRDLAVRGKLKYSTRGIGDHAEGFLSRKYSAGFCPLRRVWHDWTKQALSTWPEFSGVLTFPIRDPNGGSPVDFYLAHRARSGLWREYNLQMCLSLLDHLIALCAKENPAKAAVKPKGI